MYVLAIDTASNICSVALARDDEILAEVNVDKGLTHSETLMPMIDGVLNEVGVDKKNINLLIVDHGPGSFTGLRIGVTTANTFAQVLGIPVIGISSLDGLAASIPNGNNLICTTIDSKGGKFYTCVYRNDIKADRLMQPELLTKEEIEDRLEFETDVIYIDETKIAASNLIKFYLENKDDFTLKSNHVSPMYIKKSQADENR